MQSTTSAYDEVMARPMRNTGSLNATLYQVALGAEEGATMSDNGHETEFPSDSVLDMGSQSVGTYGAFEPDFLTCDGTMRLIADDPPYEAAGWWGDALSLVDGTFSTNPLVTAELDTTYTSHGFTIWWAPYVDEYAVDFTIKIYDGVSLLDTVTVTGNTASKYAYTEDLEDYDKVVIEISEWSTAYRRPRIRALFFGVVYEWTNDELMDAKFQSGYDPICDDIPYKTFSFTADNSDLDFDPENPSGVLSYTLERQKLLVGYGMTLDNQAVELIQPHTLYLVGTPATDTEYRVKFTSKDILSLCTMTYYKGLLRSSASPISLADLAADVESVIQETIPEFSLTVASSLSSIYTYAPVGLLPCNQVLRMIAQAGMCSISLNRDGTVEIWDVDDDASDVHFEPAGYNLISSPALDVIPPLAQVDCAHYSFTVAASAQTLHEEEYTLTGATNIYIEYGMMADEVEANVTSGSITSATYYTNCCFLTVDNVGATTLTVTGKAITQSAESVSVAGTYTDGEICAVANPLITSSAVATNVATWIGGFLANRNRYEFDTRGYFELDLGDVALLDNRWDTDMDFRLTKIDIDGVGAWAHVRGVRE